MAAIPGGLPTPRFAPSAAMRDDELLRAAFVELHGSRLHGFALIVSLGDARRAEQAVGDALAVGSRHAAALRHPERAAAWLRARALGRLCHAGLVRSSVPPATRRATLARLRVNEATFNGLASLSLVERAAVAATIMERFEAMDVETILGTSSSRTRRLVARASRRYLAAMTDGQVASATPPGELSRRVHGTAERTFVSAPAVRRVP